MLGGITSKAEYWPKSIMHGTTTTQFNCANCDALYHLIKVEAGPERLIVKLPAAFAARRFLPAMRNWSSSTFFCGNRADARRLAVP
jgi:hypothetical protein